MLPYNRALHTDDYGDSTLAPYVEEVRRFERTHCAGRFFYRKDHIHREWEYANILRQITELFPGEEGPRPVGRLATRALRILDTGFGINYFTLMLKVLGYDVIASDSEDYGKVTEVFQNQCTVLGLQIPLVIAPVQQLGMESDKNDVTLCISVIEHLHVQDFANGLRELVRVTKPGGYTMITSDFFKDEEHALRSPSLGCQHSRFYEASALDKIRDVVGDQVAFVGGTDNSNIGELRASLDGVDLSVIYHPSGIKYRGDFVNGHSFVNFCLQKRV